MTKARTERRTAGPLVGPTTWLTKSTSPRPPREAIRPEATSIGRAHAGEELDMLTSEGSDRERAAVPLHISTRWSGR